MAKETKATEANVPETPQTKPVVESTYSAREIAQNARNLFGYSQDVATAALSYNHVNECTLDEAKRLITEFAERKVN